jgi:hypothetical protein
MANTYHGLTRSQIMRRAWQLAHLNNPTCNARARQSLGRFISAAWQEAREGRTAYWTFLSAEHEARAVEDQLCAVRMSNGSDRFSAMNFELRRSLTEKLATLRASIGGAL